MDTKGEVEVVEVVIDFKPDADIKIGAVDIQDRIKRTEARLAANGAAGGNRGRGDLQLHLAIRDADLDLGKLGLSHTVTRNILTKVRRSRDVGRARLFLTKLAMTAWLDPYKLPALCLRGEPAKKKNERRTCARRAGRFKGDAAPAFRGP